MEKIQEFADYMAANTKENHVEVTDANISDWRGIGGTAIGLEPIAGDVLTFPESRCIFGVTKTVSGREIKYLATIAKSKAAGKIVELNVAMFRRRPALLSEQARCPEFNKSLWGYEDDVDLVDALCGKKLTVGNVLILHQNRWTPNGVIADVEPVEGMSKMELLELERSRKRLYVWPFTETK